MELLASLYSLKSLDKIDKYVDGVVVGYTSFTAYSISTFSKEDIIFISQKKKVFVLLNTLLHEDDLDEFKKVLLELSKITNTFFIVSDLGAVEISKELKIENRVIYQPETMITNYLDAQTYLDDNLLGLGISNEITVKDVGVICSSIPNGFYLGFGYHPMYRSYRKILSLYAKHKEIEFDKKNLELEEYTRKDRYPIIENRYESIVFRGGAISVLNEIDSLSNVKYMYIDGIFIDEEKYIVALSTYYKVLSNQIDKESGVKIINELDVKLDNTFMDNDSRYEVE